MQPETGQPHFQPAALIAGSWHGADNLRRQNHHNPSRLNETLASVAIAEPHQIAAAADSAGKAFAEWRRWTFEDRIALLAAAASRLEARIEALARLLALEIGKPLIDAREEIRRSIELMSRSLELYRRNQCEYPAEPGVLVSHQPHGVVGIVTPWNNPVAIPLGKIAPALAFGNTVLWKPAFQASRATLNLIEVLVESGLPPGTLNVVFGDHGTVASMAGMPQIAALTFTGSCDAGKAVALHCAAALKPLQAELGGNNPVVVMADADLEAAAGELALSAFSFSGQRCTATKRIIPARKIEKAFIDLFLDKVGALPLGQPLAPGVRIGPLLSGERRADIAAKVSAAVSAGCELMRGGRPPPSFPEGAWFEPTVLRAVRQPSQIEQQEVFGPVVTIRSATDIEQALSFCNGVSQGLVASIYTRSEALQRRFLDGIEAGIVKINQPTLGIAPEAPFGGWKDSGLGPPEHGIGDRQFFTRIQARYL